MYWIEAARVVTDSKLVVQLQKSDEDPVKSRHEPRGTVNKFMFDERWARGSAYGFNMLFR